jgi:hypothetical protein
MKTFFKKFWFNCIHSMVFTVCTESEFLDVTGTKVLGVFTVTSTNGFPPPPLHEQKLFECENLKSENSQNHEFGFCRLVRFLYSKTRRRI